MSALLAQCLGIQDQEAPPIESLTILLERRTKLSRAESRIALLDYLGHTRGSVLAQLHITEESWKTYWKRIYRKTGVQARQQMRLWIEQQLESER